MRNHVALTLEFGLGGNAHLYQIDGWSVPERGFTWTVGTESRLRLPGHAAPHGRVFEIRCAPFTVHQKLESQRLTLLVGDREIAVARPRSAGSFAWFIPPSASDADEMVVTFRHPDGARPSDLVESGEKRQLAFMVWSARLLILSEAPAMPAVRTSAIRLEAGLASEATLVEAAAALTGLRVDNLALCFEALCGNCEFGFFQRRCGAEPLSLLKFAAGRPALVLLGIDAGFHGIGEPEDLDPRLSPSGREWMIEEKKYGLVYHTFTPPAAATRDDMLRREAVRLKFLARKFVADMSDGEKIFVCKDEHGMSEAEVLPLLLALNRYGPCTILWATAADETHQAGRVDVIAPRMMRGYLDRLSPRENPADFSFAGWLSLCVNAALLERDRQSPIGRKG